MNEIMNEFFFLLGLSLLVVVPIGVLAAVVADKTSKQPKNELDAERLEDSLEALNLISDYLKENPSIRLGQALLNLNVLQDDVTYTPNCPPRYKLKRNIIHEEPAVTLARIEAALEKYRSN